MNKSFISSLCLMTFMSLSAKDYDAEFEISNVTTTSTRASVFISFSNDCPINGVEFCLNIPDGMSFYDVSYASEGRGFNYDEEEEEYTLVWKETHEDKGKYVFVGGWTEDEDLSAGKGDMFRVRITLNGNTATKDMFHLSNVETSSHGTIIPTRYEAGKFGANGYSSFSSTKPMLFDETTTTVYYATEIVDNTITLTQAESNTSKEEEGLILKGKEGESIFAISVAEGTDAPTNILTGCARGTKADEDVNNVHVLSTNKGVTGFYLYSGSIPPGKAYLEGANTGAPLRVVIEDVNGIQEVSAEDLEGVIFNLNGQKVNEAKKGIHVVNGKKVMF